MMPAPDVPVACRACGVTISSANAVGFAPPSTPVEIATCTSCNLSPQVATVQGWLTPGVAMMASAQLVHAYRATFRGAKFDAPAALATPPNAIVAADLSAVSALSIRPVSAFKSWLTGPGGPVVGALLSQVPNLDISTLTDAQFEQHLGPGSPASRLWHLLQGVLTVFKSPRGTYVAASKLIAAKRRKLVAPEDELVRKVLHIEERCAWKATHVLLGDPIIHASLLGLQGSLPNMAGVALPRVLDTLVWMKGWVAQHPGWVPPPLPPGWVPPPPPVAPVLPPPGGPIAPHDYGPTVAG